MTSKQIAAENPSAELADVHIELGVRPDSPHRFTNFATLLVRPHHTESDASGTHPGEQFYMLSISRQKLKSILLDLEDDWDDHMEHCGSDRIDRRELDSLNFTASGAIGQP